MLAVFTLGHGPIAAAAWPALTKPSPLKVSSKQIRVTDVAIPLAHLDAQALVVGVGLAGVDGGEAGRAERRRCVGLLDVEDVGEDHLVHVDQVLDLRL